MWISRKNYNNLKESYRLAYEELCELREANNELFWKLHNALKRNEIKPDKHGKLRHPDGRFAEKKQKELRL